MPATPCKQEPIDIPLKKAKLMDDAYMLDYQQALLMAQYRQYAFRPWAPMGPKHIPAHMPYATAPPQPLPYMSSQEPPILQNPDRVVLESECDRFARTFQPNVALAPRRTHNNNTALSASSSCGNTTNAPSTGSAVNNHHNNNHYQHHTISHCRNGSKERERPPRSMSGCTAVTSPPKSVASPVQLPQLSPAADIQIKLERPGTPDDVEDEDDRMPTDQDVDDDDDDELQLDRRRQTVSPELRVSSPTPVAIIKSTSPPPPISPEGHSGSNEITSSTSPVPAAASSHNNLLYSNSNNNSNLNTNNTNNNSNSKNVNPVETSSARSPQTPKPNDLTNNGHHTATTTTISTTNGVGVDGPDAVHNAATTTHHIRASGTTGGSNIVAMCGVLTSGNAGNNTTANSELELSTDTDDDSLVGEPDSSNNSASWDMAVEALKDTRQPEREKVLHIIKLLVTENAQFSVENAKLRQELRRKDEHITELQQHQQLHNPHQQHPHQQPDSNKPESLQFHHQRPSSAKSDSEVIRMPLKKSLRRSPDNSSVVVVVPSVQLQKPSTTKFHTDDDDDRDDHSITQLLTKLKNGELSTAQTAGDG